MIFLILYLFAILTALAFSVWAAISDFKFLKIPNVVSIVALAAFAVAFAAQYFGLPVELRPMGVITSHLASGAIMFGMTLALFAVRILGAGDSKMASAYALWFTLFLLSQYLVLITLVGGVLGVVALILRRIKPKNHFHSVWIKTISEQNSAVPYGIAIAVSFWVCALGKGYLSFELLRAFLT
ncbi:MAG: peptidase [Micavibrio sp.]|nr:peptidase [Micavibrio sp.]|tara:strand:- start:623595 stop:624143 length:549 start_codon:yes stop_codon:yes gene_type:complete